MKVGLFLLVLRPDDCCGFGGSFCVTDEAVSAKMGDRPRRGSIGDVSTGATVRRTRRAKQTA
jgi:Fe-S oxidoreductase